MVSQPSHWLVNICQMPHQIPLLHPGSDNVCLKMGEGQGHRTILKTMVSGLGSDINDSTPTFLSKVKVLSRTSRNIAKSKRPFSLEEVGSDSFAYFRQLRLAILSTQTRSRQRIKKRKIRSPAEQRLRAVLMRNCGLSTWLCAYFAWSFTRFLCYLNL